MSVEITNESGDRLDETEFAALARHVLDAMHVHPQAELEIRFVDTQVMSELHVQWMDEEGPTDVLSFPMDELRPGVEGVLSEGILGSIVVCPEVAHAQAMTAGHSAEEEMLLLTTHGILHLLGFDHAEPEEEKEMFGLQRQLLLTFLATRESGGSDV
ncbi:rRNA maturation RNase YbeY [Ruania rhizosphaerae]|uniref:rRNA maturation RNase YbeY n=1 Tax=Ruania rhizosphaerae TaxID=1840413 RepID=UPI0013568CE0|nr:rRNA maturation RNase YbeY [Ruania rhizosphaerae]